MGTITAAVDDSQKMDTSAESRFVVLEAQWRMAKSIRWVPGIAAPKHSARNTSMNSTWHTFPVRVGPVLHITHS